MPVCTPRDALDVLSALGPTIAAGLALLVSVWAVIVAKQSAAATQAGVDLQRALSNPRLSILERVYPEGGTIDWVVELQNSGISPASITALRVFVSGQEVNHPPMQGANEFWLNIFAAAGITEIGRLKGDYWRTRNVAGTSTIPMVSAVFTGPRPQIASAMRSIRVEIDYAALTGDKFNLERNLGAGQAEPRTG